MKKIHLKLAFGFVVTYCLSPSYASDRYNDENQDIFSQEKKANKRPANDLYSSRVTKKPRNEITLTSGDNFQDIDESDSCCQYTTTILNCNLILSKPNATDKEKASAYIMRASANISLEHYELAIQDCSLVLAIPGIENNTQASVYTIRAFMKSVLGQYEEAIQDCNAALQISEISNDIKASTLANKSFARCGLGQYEEAAQDYNLILNIPEICDAKKALAFRNRGLIKSNLGQIEDAISDLKKASEFENFFSLQQLSLIHKKLNLLNKNPRIM